MSQSQTPPRSKAAAYTRFIVPSLIGFAFFMLPVPQDDVWTTPMGIVSGVLGAWIGDVLPVIVVVICVISAVLTPLYSLTPRRAPGHVLEKLFRPGWVWIIVRILGAVLAVMVWQQAGPEWLWGGATGGLVLNDLLSAIVTIILVACLFLPFLTDFGLMELVGVLCERFFRTLFTVPGRSSIDAIASWVGGSSVGIIVTIDQYEKGLYSAREACVIVTNFSIVSIAFCYVVVSTIGLEAMFFPFYGVLALCGVICSIIMPRLPPLRWKTKDYYSPPPGDVDAVPTGNPFRRGLTKALDRAVSAPPLPVLGKRAVVNTLDIWLGVIPAAMTIATVALVIAEFTPVFDVLSTPFFWLLQAAGVEDAQAAAPGTIIGFTDMFIPALIAADISSPETRFVLGILAVGQLVFLSETGAFILKSSLPLNLLELAVIFLLRTIIILPVAILAAGLLF